MFAQDSYIQSRSTAIESIETTIAELGQIFNQLAHMVAEQRETVQRIDADTLDIASNVGGAQRELLKYYASISSNRWLMLKVFGVLIVFVSPPSFGFAFVECLTCASVVFDFYSSIMTDFLAVAAPHCDCIYLCTRTLPSSDFRQIDLIRTHTKVSHPMGSAFTPVPQLFVRAPRFFFDFFPSRFPPTSSSSPTVQVRFVCGTSPSPDVVEKRCGCSISCCTVPSPRSVAALCDRRVYEVTGEQTRGRVRD